MREGDGDNEGSEFLARSRLHIHIYIIKNLNILTHYLYYI